MDTLTSAFSKTIVIRLGADYTPKGAAYAINRPEFSSFPNDKKGFNFPVLKLVQNKGINPVHAMSSKVQVDSENLEGEDKKTNETKVIKMKFQLQRNCNFGEQFLLVGDDPMLGSWDPSKAIPMTWSNEHVWTVEQEIPSGKRIQFKLILKKKDGDIVWQPGPDRIIHTWESMTRITVAEDWESAQLQKIIEEGKMEEKVEEGEEDKPAQSNVTDMADSKMQTCADNSDNPKEKMDSALPKELVSALPKELVSALPRETLESILSKIKNQRNL